jgi:putative ABC transport system permease protein
MTARHRFVRWLRALVGELGERLRGRRSLGESMDADVDAYLDLLTDEKIAAGLPPAAARRAALVELGGRAVVREAVRDAHPAAVFRPLAQDLRYAVRVTARTPGLSAAVVVTMALGIGAAAATFSAVDAVLVRPLPYADADRLVVLLHHGTNAVAPANFLDWQRSATSFEAMGAAEYWSPNLRGDGAPEKILALHVTPEVLAMLGVPPTIGRLPATGPDGAREIVIADGLWHRRFAADPGVVGRAVQLDADPLVIVGVMPATFHFAPFWATKAEIWGGFDLAPRAASRGGNSLRVFAKLKPGVTLARARAEMAGITAALEAQYPGTNRDLSVTPLKDKVVGDVRATLLVLFGAVGCVLLIACANVAHLLLARASTREREFAVRCAIGASRNRVVRQLLTESVTLSLAGGAAGVLLAFGGVHVFTALGATSVPRLQTMTLDGRVLIFATSLAVLTGLLFGIAPARALARISVSNGLRSEDRGSTSARASRGARRLLIASQVALALVLLVGAGLLLRSFVALRAVDPGFSADRLASFVVSVSGSAESAPGRRGAFYNELTARVRSMPGVASVAAINHMPLVGDIWGFPYFVEGRPAPRPGEAPTATFRVASAAYFETMGISMVSGRTLTSMDRDGGPPVIIVNESLARDAWPGESAIGKRLRVPAGPDPRDQVWRTVIGVSRNTVRGDLHDTPEPELFIPLEQNQAYRAEGDSHFEAMTIVVRTTAEPAVLVPSIRAVVRGLAPDVPISDVFLMRQVVDEAADGTRFTLVLLGTFAGVALVLAALGIAGVISHDVASRRREIGIRLALGAAPARVAAQVAGEGLTAAVVGLGAGLAAAAALRGAVTSLLFLVTPFDGPTLATVTLALMLVAGTACGLPAYRASRISPAEELK